MWQVLGGIFLLLFGLLALPGEALIGLFLMALGGWLNPREQLVRAIITHASIIIFQFLFSRRAAALPQIDDYVGYYLAAARVEARLRPDLENRRQSTPSVRVGSRVVG